MQTLQERRVGLGAVQLWGGLQAVDHRRPLGIRTVCQWIEVRRRSCDAPDRNRAAYVIWD
jgi:hypothetical protein